MPGREGGKEKGENMSRLWRFSMAGELLRNLEAFLFTCAHREGNWCSVPVRLSPRPDLFLEEYCVVSFLYLKVLVNVSALGDGTESGRRGKRPDWGGGLGSVPPWSECFGGIWEGGPTLGAPLTLPISVFLKIPCVPAAVLLLI